MWLLLVALFALLVPNGLFIYWLLNDLHSFGAVLQDKLILGFMLDVLVAQVLLTVDFASRPIGRVTWPWFAFLSLLGGLGFSLPLLLAQPLRPQGPAGRCNRLCLSIRLQVPPGGSYVPLHKAGPHG